MSTYYYPIRFYGKSFDDEKHATKFLKKHNINYESDSPYDNPDILTLFYASNDDIWCLGYVMDAHSDTSYASQKWYANFRGEEADAMLIVYVC